MGREEAVSVRRENVPMASLPWHLEQALAKVNTVSLLILGGNTVVFLPTTEGYFLVDSHLHRETGALVAFCKNHDIFQLLQWFRDINGPRFTLGTVTNVSFL